MQRRKTVIINKSFQYKLVIYLLLTGLTLSFLFLIPYIIIKSNYDMFINTAIEFSPNLVESLNKEKNFFIYLFFSFSVLGLLSLLAIGISFSHKIAGPVYSFQKAVNKLIDGKLDTTFKLRKNDELKELENTFEKIKEKIKAT
jgi:signal peptidase II